MPNSRQNSGVGMGMGFAPTWLRQVSPPASQNHFNHCFRSCVCNEQVARGKLFNKLTNGLFLVFNFFVINCHCYRQWSVQSGSAADGSYLLAVDDGDKRTLVVWEWRSRSVVARTVVSQLLSSVSSCRFNV